MITKERQHGTYILMVLIRNELPYLMVMASDVKTVTDIKCLQEVQLTCFKSVSAEHLHFYQQNIQTGPTSRRHQSYLSEFLRPYHITFQAAPLDYLGAVE